MFYLEVFWKSLFLNKINAIIFIFLLSLNFILIGNQDFFQGFITQKIFNLNQEVSFRGIISSSLDFEKIAKKMRAIPGVKDIKKIDITQSKTKLQKELSASEIYIPKYMFETSINAVEVLLSSELQKKNHELIKDYFFKVTQSSETVVSEITYPEGLSKKRWVERSALFAINGLIGLICILQIFSLFRLTSELSSRSYLLGQYQRKSYIQLKSFGIGFSSLFLMITVPFYFFYRSSVLYFAINFIVLCLFYQVFSIILQKKLKARIF
jgi:hypothetical protein